MTSLAQILPPKVGVSKTGMRPDYRPAFAESVRRRPIARAYHTAFLRNKMHIARTHPAGPTDLHEHVLRQFARTLGEIPTDVAHQPAPGGVGYGMFYKETFRADFAAGTDLVWEVVCPEVAGGNNATYLYETATNRAAGGVEALVSYDGSQQFAFQIYDWSREESQRWSANMPFSEMINYIGKESHQGRDYPVLPIWNSTTRSTVGTWANEVHLYDYASNTWALVYQNVYDMDDAAQRTGWVGSWAPIVETFQDVYTGLNPLGALGTRLRSADANGTWSDWTLLDATMSALRKDQARFEQAVLDPNYDWVVRS